MRWRRCLLILLMLLGLVLPAWAEDAAVPAQKENPPHKDLNAAVPAQDREPSDEDLDAAAQAQGREPSGEDWDAPAAQAQGKPSYDELLTLSQQGSAQNQDASNKVPSGNIPLEEIQKLKEKALKYRETVDSPPAKHPGAHRVLPYLGEPQKILTAVGYGTVIRVPFEIRPQNGVIVGDKESFRVEILDPVRVAVFPVQPFWSSNLMIFPKEENMAPVLLFLEEAYGTGKADYYVEILRGAEAEMDVHFLLTLASTGGSLGDAAADALRSPQCRKGEGGIRMTCQLVRPDYRVLVLSGTMECLSGCDLWVEAPDMGATIVGAYPGSGVVKVCEKRASKYAARECREIRVQK